MSETLSQTGKVNAQKRPDMPLVSIVTPVLNGVKYLEECVQSVLNQSYPNIEHIFVDGGSTDGSLEMISSYQSRYPDRIKFISGPDNGVGEALNQGFKIATGYIFGWLDSDDLYEPDAIMAAVEFFRSNPDAYLVFGESDIIDETGKLVGKHPVKDWDMKEAINDRHYIVMGATFYRHEVFEKAGCFNVLGNDLDFWLRVAKHFRMWRMGKTLYRNRQHKDTFTNSKDPRKVQTNRERYREDYLLCRQYGGGLFAPRVRRYLVFLALDKLRLYRIVASSILPKLQRYALVKKVLRLMGA